jgi:hypothetical protein
MVPKQCRPLPIQCLWLIEQGKVEDKKLRALESSGFPLTLGCERTGFDVPSTIVPRYSRVRRPRESLFRGQIELRDRTGYPDWSYRRGERGAALGQESL